LEAFAQRDLSGLDVVYLFADAVYESLRRQAGCREGVLVTWAPEERQQGAGAPEPGQ
jgi:transposase-like protein